MTETAKYQTSQCERAMFGFRHVEDKYAANAVNLLSNRRLEDRFDVYGPLA